MILAHYCHMNEQLEELKRVYGERVELLQADFMDTQSISDMITLVKEKNNYPEHIVHFPAGKFGYMKYEKAGLSEFSREMQISFYSLIQITQAFLPYMKKQNAGKIIVMLTACTQGVPPRFMASYVAVKYAMLGLVKALAADYADRGIQINGVSPEMIETKFLQSIPDFVKEQNAQNHPLKRNLQVGDVIPTIEYLLSNASDCVTGQNICITGGK